jgi:hypothetical protein
MRLGTMMNENTDQPSMNDAVAGQWKILYEEYNQCADDIRNGWNYIFTFFRHFFSVQMILFPAVLFGSKSSDLITNHPGILYLVGAIVGLFCLAGGIHNMKLFQVSGVFLQRIVEIEKLLYGESYVSGIQEAHERLPHYTSMLLTWKKSTGPILSSMYFLVGVIWFSLPWVLL